MGIHTHPVDDEELSLLMQAFFSGHPRATKV